MVSAGAGEHDCERDGGDHEEYCRPGGELGEQRRRATRTEGRLRTLTAEGASEVGGAALLQKDDSDKEERNDNVDDNNEIEHRGSFTTFLSQNVWIGAEEGT